MKLTDLKLLRLLAAMCFTLAVVAVSWSQTVTAITVSPMSTQGGTPAAGIVTLSGNAGPAGAIVSLTSSNGAATVFASVVVLSGDKTATFSIFTSPVSADTDVTIAGTLNGSTASTTFQIVPASLESVSAVGPVLGGSSATGWVTLSGLAGANGTVVNLSSNNKALILPPSVTVAAVANEFTFKTTRVSSPTTVTITATLGEVTQTTTVKILSQNSLASLSVYPTVTPGGTGTYVSVDITLQAPSGAGGTEVRLASNSPCVAIPSSVTIPAGRNYASLSLMPTAVSRATAVTLTGTMGGATQKVSFVVDNGFQFSVSPETVLTGTSTKGTITLTAPAPPGGLAFSLKAEVSGSVSVTMPSTVTVHAGATQASFPISTGASTSDGFATVTAVDPNGLSSLSYFDIAATWELQDIQVNPTSVSAGSQVPVTVTLNLPAPSGGIVVSLGSSNASAVTVPPTVTVPAGQTFATVAATVQKLNVGTSLTLNANLDGETRTASLSVTIPLPGVTFTVLDPVGWPNASVVAIGSNSQFGKVYNQSGQHAALWSGSSNSFLDLNPPSWDSSSLAAASGKLQAGSVTNQSPNSSISHAAVWAGTSTSFYDLNPRGAVSSIANGIFANVVVGSYVPTGRGGVSHAVLWKGDAVHWVDLNPANWTNSVALATDGKSIVGQVGGDPGFGLPSAAYWSSGTNTSFVDLQPQGIGWWSSATTGVDGNTQIGWFTQIGMGAHQTTVIYGPYAAIWTGTAASLKSINPGGWFASEANGLTGDVIVGSVTAGAVDPLGDYYPLFTHAGLWWNLGSNFIDLQAASGGNWSFSTATGVYADAQGLHIVGNADGQAILWFVPAGALPQSRLASVGARVGP